MNTPSDSDGSPSSAVQNKVFRFALPIPIEDKNANFFANVSQDAQNRRQIDQLCGMFRSALLQVDETRPLNLRCSMCFNQRSPTDFRNVEELTAHFMNKHNLKAVFMSQ